MTKPNPEQLKVINHEGGPLLVVAGAGTGKTKTIIGHINRLLDENVPSRSILALTFTEKAAQEMLNRLLDSRQAYDLDIPIHTFNAFGEKLLREFAADAGLSRNFTLLKDNSQIVFMRERFSEFDLDYFDTAGSPDYPLKEIAEHISTAKQNLIDPETYQDFTTSMPESDEAEAADKAKYQELAKHYQTYQRLCAENNVVDYDDQIYLLVQLLRKRPNIRKILQDRFHTILVDEFQDTNPMQSELIDLLINEKKNLIVVGDDDQSIYGFRGATLRNILEFTTRYPEAKVVTLLTNYRSNQNILDRSYQLIANNNPDRLEEKLGINKRLVADRGNGPEPQFRCFSSLSDELGWVAHDIKTRIDNDEPASDIAVLTRGNARAEQVSEALASLNIEHDLVGGSYDLYSEPAVAMILEALTAIARTDDNRALYNALVSELFSTDISALAALLSGSYRSHELLCDLIENSHADELETARRALEQIKQWRVESANLRITQIAYKVIRESGYIERLDSYGRQNAAAEAESVQTFGRIYQLFRKLKEFEKVAMLPSLQAFIDDLPTIKTSSESVSDDTLDLSSQRVSVLTTHKAKGLEWQTVYIVGAVQGSFPFFGGSSGIPLPPGLISEEEADKRVNEERRLMYVAVTRAKQNLLISYASNKAGEQRPSQFLIEMFGRDEVLGTEPEPENTELRLDIVGDGAKIPDEIAIPETIIARDGTIFLSPSAIETFNRCPYDYYWRFIRHVPDEPRTTLDIGTLLHTEFEKFNRGKQAGQLPPLSELLQSLEDNFPKIGFYSQADRAKRLNQALDALADFYERHKNDDEKVLAVEEEFRIRFNEEKIVIRGRYDAVFEVSGKVVIRDYKSGRTNKTPEKAKQKANASEQLTMYAMAWQDSTGDLPARLELEFVETHQLGAVARKQASIETMRKKIIRMAECIRQRNFPMGEQHQYCKHPH